MTLLFSTLKSLDTGDNSAISLKKVKGGGGSGVIDSVYVPSLFGYQSFLFVVFFYVSSTLPYKLQTYLTFKLHHHFLMYDTEVIS